MKHIKEILEKNRFLIAVYIVIGIFNAFLTNYKVSYFQKLIDGLSLGKVTLALVLGYGVILIVHYCMNYVDEYPSKKLEQGIFLDFKLLALKKISQMDYLAYQSMGTGKLMQRIENGAQAGKSLIYDFWFCVIRELIPTIAFSIFFIWRINRIITIGLMIGYIVIFIITNLLLKALYQMKEKILIGEEEMNHYLVRGFMEMLVFRMARQFPREIKKASLAKNEIVCTKVKMNMIHEAFFTIFALLVALLNVGVLIYAAFYQTISVGEAVALMTLIEQAYTPVAIFNVLFVEYKLDQATFKRFEAFLNLEDDRQLEEGKEVTSLQGGIEVKNLNFNYDNHCVFENLNLSITPGEKVAFVGESGSGKTTLIKMISGLIKYQGGSIKIDGEELSNLCLNSLYAHLSYLSQDSPIFDGSIRENLVFNQEVPEKSLMAAIKQVQLLPLVQKLEAGLDTAVGEKGATLSGGEKQRLALARLWFEEKEIILLDEVTSAMDNLTEEKVMTQVMKQLDTHTVIAVAHRLNAIADFDRIVVFNKGRIVGQGRFEELIVDNPYFIQLYKARSEEK